MELLSSDCEDPFALTWTIHQTIHQTIH